MPVFYLFFIWSKRGSSNPVLVRPSDEGVEGDHQTERVMVGGCSEIQRVASRPGSFAFHAFSARTDGYNNHKTANYGTRGTQIL